jgi:hypothetical protein
LSAHHACAQNSNFFDIFIGNHFYSFKTIRQALS